MNPYVYALAVSGSDLYAGGQLRHESVDPPLPQSHRQMGCKQFDRHWVRAWAFSRTYHYVVR